MWRSCLSLTYLFLFFSGISIAHATMISTTWLIDGLYQYDYPSGTYVTPTVPTSFELSILFPSTASGFTDYGQATITRFGDLGDTTFWSPLTAYVGADPFGSGLEGQAAYTFPNVSDYPTSFVEEFAAQSNVYSPSGDLFWNYHIELRARRYSDSMGGLGEADYAFTTDSLIDFLIDVIETPDSYQVSFNESWQIFDQAQFNYLDGASWSSYSVELLGFEEVNSVPEPGVLALLAIGAPALAFAIRRLPSGRSGPA